MLVVEGVLVVIFLVLVVLFCVWVVSFLVVDLWFIGVLYLLFIGECMCIVWCFLVVIVLMW